MSVFDARSQLVDEAAESSYLADSARERAARLREQSQTTVPPLPGSVDTAATGSNQRLADDDRGGHGAGWVSPGGDLASDYRHRNPAVERSAPGRRPRGHILIDRRESEADIDLDHADTIAYQPFNESAEAPRQSETQRGAEYGLRADRPSAAERSSSETAELELAERGGDLAPAPNDYSQRIDPLINPDDKAIEFEQTLALDGLTGIEADYPQPAPGVGRRSVVERSVEAVSESTAAGTSHASSYVGEHQFDAPRQPDTAGSAQAQTPRYRPRERLDLTNDPDIVNRPAGPPRSERHLPEHQQSNLSDSYSDGHQRQYESGDIEAAHHSLDQPSDRSDSATAMRQHLNERGVTIDSDDAYAQESQARSGSLGWLLLALLAVGCAAAMYARDDIAKSNLPQSVRAAFCSVAGCELPVASNIADLELLRQKVYSHPSIEGALVVSIDVVNNAVFPQPYPVLAITMANGSGEAVAQRDFAPADYLENYAGDEVLGAGKPTRINIDIVDPGADAQSFEMEFRQL